MIRHGYDRARPLFERAAENFRAVVPVGQYVPLDGLATIDLNRSTSRPKARLDEAINSSTATAYASPPFRTRGPG